MDYSSLYEVDYNTYYTTGSLNYTFMAESALTGAISRVTSDSSYLLYQLSGHGELELGTDLTETLTNANVTVESLNLLSAGSIPEDAAVLLINTPQVDYSADSIALLRSYLRAAAACW